MEIANDELTRSLSTDSNAPSIETIYSRLQRQGALRGLVRIFVKSYSPSYQSPWLKGKQRTSMGSGFVLEGLNNHIITNAHVVRHAIGVRVRINGETKRWLAKVVSVSFDLDLAVLQPVDTNFWKSVNGSTVLLRKKTPTLGEEVAALGYPRGDNASITKGVVSRCQFDTFLRVQVDAAINAGNSGGPVFDAEGKCVGVAFAAMNVNHGQNICYIIPVEVLNQFLSQCYDSETKQYTQFPGKSGMGLEYQSCENADLRSALGLDKELYNGRGIRVKRVIPFTAATDKLLEDDVILSIDGESIASDGTVKFRENERIPWRYLYRRKNVGENVSVEILRKNESVFVDMELANIISKCPSDGDPNFNLESWCIIGGAVFLPMTQNLLRSHRKHHPRVLKPEEMDFEEDLDEQFVILSHILAHDINFGYQSWKNYKVEKINGTKPKNLRHFAEITLDPKVLTFDILFEHGNRMLLKRESCEKAKDEIIEIHGLKDMLKINGTTNNVEK